MKNIIRFFLSIKTAYVFFIFFAAIMFYGSLSLPNNLTFFSGIDDTPLFRWLLEQNRLGITWWIWLLVIGLALFAVNTIFCTADALLYRMNKYAFIAKLSPQIMHLGVLFVMLGHLLTASFGVKLDVDLKAGETRQVSGVGELFLDTVAAQEDKNGYVVDWDARIRWTGEEKAQKTITVGPVRPASLDGFMLYSKSVIADAKDMSALVRVVRDPGAVWALIGGVLLCFGGAGYVLSGKRVR